MSTAWQVPGYREIRELGHGGAGRVVEALNLSGATVAIKYLNDDLLADDYFRAEFRHEARLLSSIVSPHVTRLYEYVETPAGAAIVMEFVTGASLRATLQQHGPTDPEAALAVLKGSLLGLSVAHQIGVVHRDYKPENVLITTGGDSKLVDFGVATRAGHLSDGSGTPAYMAPEQWDVGATATPSSDIYAATATFVECVSGQQPFQADDLPTLRSLHERAPLPVRLVPDSLRSLVQRGLAKDPAQRPADATAFLTELEHTAVAHYGHDWEQRGYASLAHRVTLLALAAGAGGALAGTTATSAAAGAGGTISGTSVASTTVGADSAASGANAMSHLARATGHLPRGVRSARFIKRRPPSSRRWRKKRTPHPRQPLAGRGITVAAVAVLALVVGIIAALLINTGHPAPPALAISDVPTAPAADPHAMTPPMNAPVSAPPLANLFSPPAPGPLVLTLPARCPHDQYRDRDGDCVPDCDHYECEPYCDHHDCEPDCDHHDCGGDRCHHDCGDRCHHDCGDRCDHHDCRDKCEHRRCEDKPDCDRHRCEDKPDCDRHRCEDKPDCEHRHCGDGPEKDRRKHDGPDGRRHEDPDRHKHEGKHHDH